MAHRDRVGGSSGRKKDAGDAVHRQNFSTPSDGPLTRPERRLAKAFGRRRARFAMPRIATAHAPSGLHQLNCTHTTALRGFRLGARRAVMREHHKRRATTPGAAGASPVYRSRGDTPLVPPGASQDRPSGRVSRSLGASGTLADGSASPARPLLPRKRETRSYDTRIRASEY